MNGTFRRFGLISTSLFFPAKQNGSAKPDANAAEMAVPKSTARLRLRWPAGLAAALSGMWGAAALAGGYAIPIASLPPAPPALAAGAPQNWWMALIPLFLLALASRGGGGGRGDNGLNPLPPDHGGPCFGETTLIQTDGGWTPVESLRVGDRVVTSRGVQTILAVDSWQPVDYRDRPVVVRNVRLSPNHGVAVGDIIVPACRLPAVRARIDGSRYVHILVQDHSWLFAKADSDGPVIRAESLCMTADLKLARTFPDLVARHAADPVAPVRVGMATPRTSLTAA